MNTMINLRENTQLYLNLNFKFVGRRRCEDRDNVCGFFFPIYVTNYYTDENQIQIK